MLNQVVQYFLSSRDELKKVTWPSRDETVKKTVLVIIISLVVAGYIGILDYIFNLLLGMVI